MEQKKARKRHGGNILVPGPVQITERTAPAARDHRSVLPKRWRVFVLR
jgi:hypothetical protein